MASLLAITLTAGLSLTAQTTYNFDLETIYGNSRAGRDELPEKAVELIEKGSSTTAPAKKAF